jgi:phage terminase large subunit-like protein
MNSSSAVRPIEPEAVLPQAPPPGIAPVAGFFDAEAWAAATAQPGDWFDERAAEHVCAFFPRYLRHTKGRWAGQPFFLLPWQRSGLRAAFGWKRADGSRRFRIVWCEIPRKNGKTGLAAGVGLYLAFASGEPGAEVYSGASAKTQAAIAFNEAKRMRAQSSQLRELTNAFKYNISRPDNFSKYEVIAADYGTLDGLNLSGLIGDEVHAWKNREFYEVLHTAEGARTQPMEFLITTAGTDIDTLGGEMHEHAERVRDGVIEDHAFLPIIYGTGRDDDWTDPAVWANANPSLGATVTIEAIAAEAERAKKLPRYQNAFKRYYLNIWTEQETIWLPIDKWSQCTKGPESVTLEALAGRRCFGGLDLSSTTDLTALALLFPRDDGADLWMHFWMPKEGLAERVRRDRVPYDKWADQGFITLTDGDVVDYDVIRRMITGEAPGADPEFLVTSRKAAITNQVELVALARDRWNATQLTTQLMGDGVEIKDFGQGYASMSAPSKEFEKLVVEGTLNHGGNPVIDWMARVVTVRTDGADNVKPVKPDRRRSTKRIDGIVAGIMALGLAISTAADQEPEYQMLFLA